MSVLVAIIRAIGLPAALVVGLLLYYEGVPGASRIPFLSSIPILGDLTTGRVHAYAAEQVKLATANLVSRFELTAAKAQLDRERELRERADRLTKEANERAADAAEAERIASANLEEAIRADNGDGGVWSQSDDDWVQQHR